MYTPVGFFAPQGGGWVTANLLQYIDPFTSTIGGGTASDLSGNGNDATLENSITTDSSGWVLDSSSPKYLDLGLGNTNTDTAFSMEVFIKFDSSAVISPDPAIVANYDQVPDRAFGIYISSATNKVYCFVRTTDPSADVSVQDSAYGFDNTFHQYVLVRDSSTILMYKDGSLLGSNTIGSGITTRPEDWWAGGPVPAFPSRYINGARLGLIRMYTSALSAAEVLQNYNANKADYGL